MTTTPVARTLQRAREHAGLTQEQVAKAMGVTKATISHYETGKYPPPARRLHAFLSACGADDYAEYDPGEVEEAIRTLERAHTHVLLAVSMFVADFPDEDGKIVDYVRMLHRHLGSNR